MGPPTYHPGGPGTGVQGPESNLVTSLHPHCWRLSHSWGSGGTEGSTRESLTQQMFPEHLMCEGQRGEAPGQRGQLCRAKLANPSPLTLPGPIPPLATPFSQPNSLEAIFLWERKTTGKSKIAKRRLGRGDEAGCSVSLACLSQLQAPHLVFHSVTLISWPTSPVSLPPSVPSRPSTISVPCPTLRPPQTALVDGCPLRDPGQALTEQGG